MLGFAIGINDLLVPAYCIVIAQGNHLAEHVDRLGILALIALDCAQALQEHRAIIALALAIAVIGLLGLLQKILQSLRGFIEAALRLVNGRHVVGHFDGILHHALGFLQILQRKIEFAAFAVYLSHVQVGLRVFRIRVGDDLVLFERGVGLAIVHQVLSQAADGIEIVAIQFDGMPVGVNRFLVLLLLFVGVAEGGVHLGGAPRVRNRAQSLHRSCGVPLLVVEVRQRGDRLLGIRL